MVTLTYTDEDKVEPAVIRIMLEIDTEPKLTSFMTDINQSINKVETDLSKLYKYRECAIERYYDKLTSLNCIDPGHVIHFEKITKATWVDGPNGMAKRENIFTYFVSELEFPNGEKHYDDFIKTNEREFSLAERNQAYKYANDLAIKNKLKIHLQGFRTPPTAISAAIITPLNYYIHRSSS